jgi:hypothetical protein
MLVTLVLAFMLMTAGVVFAVGSTPQAITFAALGNKTYGDAAFTVSASADSGLPVSLVASGGYCVGSGTVSATITITGVGTCTVTASQAGDATYAAATPVGQTFSISKANQTITFAALANKAYADPPFTVSATASSGLAVAFSVAGNCTSGGNNGATITITGLGICAVTASQVGNANYNAASVVVQPFTVNKATLIVTAANQSKVYGEATPTLTFTYSGFKGYESASVLTTAPTCTTDAGQYANAGIYLITCSGGVDDNYAFGYVPGFLTIAKATLTVIAANHSKAYGAVNPVLTFTYYGFKGTDNAATLSRAPSCRTTATQSSPVGSYPVTCSGGMDDNYAFSFVSGSLTVTPVLPSAPLAPAGSPDNRAVRVSWLAPSSHGGGITDYVVQYRRKGYATWVVFPDGVSPDRHAQVTGLSNRVLYQFRVAACNGAGTGPWSAVMEMRAGVPTSPQAVVPTPTSRQVQLSWQSPTSDGGAAISDYMVQYRRKGTATWIAFADGVSAALHAHVTGLANGVVYQFRVVAVNARGTGMWSTVVEAQPRA